MTTSLLSNFLPSDLLTFFDIVDFKIEKDPKTDLEVFKIFLDEKNVLPSNYSSNDYESKGFNNVTLIQDFPIRGKSVYLGIRTRRWRHKIDKSKEVKSDFSFIAEGSKLTSELSDFLKDTGRY